LSAAFIRSADPRTVDDGSRRIRSREPHASVGACEGATMSTPHRIAVVTGANRGLGRSTALALAESGVDLILTYRSNVAEAAAVVDAATALGRTAVALPLDVGQTADVDGFAPQVHAALKEHWDRDRFDILINNAGHASFGMITEMTRDNYDELMNVHVKGVYFLTQALLPLIADGGRIVNLSTGLARFATPGWSSYAMAKGAIEVFTRYLAKELGPRGISVNTVAPGPIATDFAGGAIRDSAEAQAHLGGQAAFGRVGLADDIGPAIAALLAPGAGWITAQRIEASGGMLI
jgi:NAD(P)-dependent dehydrogenase (short-subunit alcohol dehydrogenase family)